MIKETKELTYEDKWTLLAKLIYSMTSKQQTTFRRKFPPGIGDMQVDDAISYARSILN